MEYDMYLLKLKKLEQRKHQMAIQEGDHAQREVVLGCHTGIID